MGFAHLFGKEAVLGIDIGSGTVKVLEVEAQGSGWRVVNAAVEQMPPGSCRDGVIVNIEDVAHTVRNAVKASGTRATQGITAISGSQVIVRQVQFPKMPEAALRKSIKYEASKFISAPMEESVVEFEILGDAEEPGLMNVMLVAAPRDMVESRVQVLEMAGIEPIAVDVESFALIRALINFRPGVPGLEKTVALIDIGGTHTDVNIVSKGNFALTRNIPIAGDSFTNSIRSVFNVSLEEANKLKREMVVPNDLNLSQLDSDNRLWRAVHPIMEELLREIRRSINYYHSQLPEGTEGAQISRILLCGGSALIPGIDRYFSNSLGIPAEVADVFSGSLVSQGELLPDFASQYGPELSVAIGLALKDEEPAVLKKALAA